MVEITCQNIYSIGNLVIVSLLSNHLNYWQQGQEFIPHSHPACRAEDVFPHGDGKLDHMMRA